MEGSPPFPPGAISTDGPGILNGVAVGRSGNSAYPDASPYLSQMDPDTASVINGQYLVPGHKRQISRRA